LQSGRKFFIMLKNRMWSPPERGGIYFPPISSGDSKSLWSSPEEDNI